MSRHGLGAADLDSSLGDSFEISAADLEVGAIAARRAKEKASDRRRRQSLDAAPHTQAQAALLLKQKQQLAGVNERASSSQPPTVKVAASPDISAAKVRWLMGVSCSVVENEY